LISASRLLLRSKTDSATTRVLVSSINVPSFGVLDSKYVGDERPIFKVFGAFAQSQLSRHHNRAEPCPLSG
jgi:hypothetical protein